MSLPSGSSIGSAIGVDVEVDLAVRPGAVEVAVGADVVDLLPGGSDRGGHACLLS